MKIKLSDYILFPVLMALLLSGFLYTSKISAQSKEKNSKTLTVFLKDFPETGTIKNDVPFLNRSFSLTVLDSEFSSQGDSRGMLIKCRINSENKTLRKIVVGKYIVFHTEDTNKMYKGIIIDEE